MVTMLEYRHMTIFLQKAMSQIGLKKCLWSKKVKNTVPWTYVISDLGGEETVGTFHKKGIGKNKSTRVYTWKSNKEKRW